MRRAKKNMAPCYLHPRERHRNAAASTSSHQRRCRSTTARILRASGSAVSCALCCSSREVLLACHLASVLFCIETARFLASVRARSSSPSQQPEQQAHRFRSMRWLRREQASRKARALHHARCCGVQHSTIPCGMCDAAADKWGKGAERQHVLCSDSSVAP